MLLRIRENTFFYISDNFSLSRAANKISGIIAGIQSKKEQVDIGLTNMLLQAVLVNAWSSQRTISLKAEELVAESYSSGFEDTKNNLQLGDSTEASLISIKEEDHIDIDLKKINENRWANHIIKEKGQRDEKSIVIHQEELIDFIDTIKATFGTFVVKSMGGN